MKLSNKVIGLLTVVMAGLTAPVLAEDSPKTTSPAHPLVIEDWFGKEGSPDMDATGTTASVTFLDRSGERWVKLTYNIVSGGYAGYWQSLSPENVVNLSEARSLKLKIKNSYPADAGLCMNDANHVNYVVGFKSTTDLKEVLVPFSAFFKNPSYTPPGAVTGHPMDMSQASYIWVGINTPGKGEFTVGPVMASPAVPYEEKFKEALQDFRDSDGKLTLPAEARKFFDQAVTESKKHHAFEAEGLYYQAILLAPWYADPHFPLAKLFADKEMDYEDAVAEMKKFIELAPDSDRNTEAEQDIQLWENMK